MFRFRSWVLAACLPTLLACGGGLTVAQDIQTMPAKAEKPKEVQSLNNPAMAMAFMSPPNKDALFNRKQQRVRDHHRPTPIKGLPAGAMAAPPQPLVAATPVTTTVTPKATSTVRLTVNRVLADAETNNDTSTVSEPSVAVRGAEVLVTANWFAAFSKNAGATFTYLNPANTFPDSPQGGFCCDQVVLYDKAHDVMFWLLQYVNNTSGNTLRLAVAKGADITNQSWRYYDFTPQGVGNWAQEWFDFPDLTLSGKYLYLSSNAFGTTGDEAFKRSALLRLPLDKLAAYDGFDYQYFSTAELGSLRATQGAKDTVYFGAQLSLAAIRVYTWPEAGTAITPNDVAVQAWSNNGRVAPGPDGRDWLGRADGRITAAWVSGDKIGFAWTAAQDDTFAYPHVRVALVDKNTKAVAGQPHIWNNNFAFAYPAAGPNADGRVGVAVHYGGNNLYPSHSVGVLTPTNTWDLVTTAAGRFGPNDNRWGDYGAVRTDGGDPKAWAATGFTLRTGPLRTDVEVRYVRFHLAGN